MSETKFTPGPWQQDHRRTVGGMWSTEVFCANGETIATLAWYPRPAVKGVVGTYREANARLIAAAPDMYAALQCAQNVLTLLQDEVSRLGCRADQVTEKIAAALAKANGEQA